jgi:hypothetical protein
MTRKCLKTWHRILHNKINLQANNWASPSTSSQKNNIPTTIKCFIVGSKSGEARDETQHEQKKRKIKEGKKSKNKVL